MSPTLEPIDPGALRAQALRTAEAEYEAEKHRELVEKHKVYLRWRENFWVRLFPWRIRIERRQPPHQEHMTKAVYHANELRKLGYSIRERNCEWYIDQNKTGRFK